MTATVRRLRVPLVTLAATVAGVTSTPSAIAALPIPPSERLEPQAEAVVRQIAAWDAPPAHQLSTANARKLPSAAESARIVQAANGQPPAVEAVGRKRHIKIPGPGGELIARVYKPAGEGPFPVLVYFHGGGWVIANPGVYDSSARALTNASQHIVVSVGYRQAPENPFPAAANDAYASFRWVYRNAAALGGIPGQVAVGGESAGGNLAAVAALMARDRGGPQPTHQLLVYPITNYAFNTPSYRQHAASIPLSRPLMRWFWRRYLERPSDGRNPYASPLRARSLRGLPSATVITAENDPLRSEGEAYAARLAQSGVQVDATRYDGVMHEFFGMGAVIDDAKSAVAQAGRNLQNAAAQN